jgi:hypothetical protein
MNIQEETRKFLDEFTELNRKEDGDVPVVYLKEALKKAIDDYETNQMSFEFITSLCTDIRLEMTASNETDEQFFQIISECEDLSDKSDINKKEEIKKIKSILL